MSENSNESLLDMFVFETNQLIEQVEEILLKSEEKAAIAKDDMNELFRAMHTIKGSSAMMSIDNICVLAHSLEDVCFFIRENNPVYNVSSVCDIAFETLDFIKEEINEIQKNNPERKSGQYLVEKIKGLLDSIKSGETVQGQPEARIKRSDCQLRNTNLRYNARIIFEDDCQMVNIRAYSLVNGLKDFCQELEYKPEDLLADESSSRIKEMGLELLFSTDKDYGDIKKFLGDFVYVKSVDLNDNEKDLEIKTKNSANEQTAQPADGEKKHARKQSMISIQVNKLDTLMDLASEIVISEAMVTRNPDLYGLELDNFSKAARQLRKLIDELQDIVMAMRMIPIENTFQKMHRVVRDMGKRLGKQIQLVLAGEDTEVDKNIIDNLSDPIMHLIRNAVDHGIETVEERIRSGKPEIGVIKLEAKNTGSDIMVTISDDGKGLDKKKILQKAKKNGLLTRNENELTDREIYNFILLPGFSTKEEVTEYSGRGVGMDVVKKNIETLGGSVFIESEAGKGTSVIMKIPLTLAIINGIEMMVGNQYFTVPVHNVIESLRPKNKDIIKDVSGNEMLMLRGNCYPLIRLHKEFGIETEVAEFTDGIVIVLGNDEKTVCIFVDKIIGEQQVVVKSLPNYLTKFNIKAAGISGCTILGDGSISLILSMI